VTPGLSHRLRKTQQASQARRADGQAISPHTGETADRFPFPLTAQARQIHDHLKDEVALATPFVHPIARTLLRRPALRKVRAADFFSHKSVAARCPHTHTPGSTLCRSAQAAPPQVASGPPFRRATGAFLLRHDDCSTDGVPTQQEGTPPRARPRPAQNINITPTPAKMSGGRCRREV
jgi:hypothetical protein